MAHVAERIESGLRASSTSRSSEVPRPRIEPDPTAIPDSPPPLSFSPSYSLSLLLPWAPPLMWLPRWLWDTERPCGVESCWPTSFMRYTLHPTHKFVINTHILHNFFTVCFSSSVLFISHHIYLLEEGLGVTVNAQSSTLLQNRILDTRNSGQAL